MTDYRKLCIELFGTDDVEQLKKIARKKKPGRKQVLSDENIEKIFEMSDKGIRTEDIAKAFNTSRQTVSKYLNSFPVSIYPLQLNFMFGDTINTEIYVNFKNKRIKAVNYTQDIPERAFGNNEHPIWDDFMYFLESRCFPQSRGNKKHLLNALGLQDFDALQIIEKTKGRMAEDNFYINFIYRKENN